MISSQMDIVFTLRLRRDKDMTTDLFLKMVGSYFMIFGGVYLLVTMIELIEDYLREKRLLKTLNRIESKVDQLPGVDKDKDDDLEERWWFANR
jgi:uncharacterized protein Yka (UPF0111/DUF47 family)